MLDDSSLRAASISRRRMDHFERCRMARIVIGIGSSHSPTLLMEPDAWLARAGWDDVKVHALHDLDGSRISYEELLAKTPASMQAQIASDVLAARHRQNQASVVEVRERLRAAEPDVVLVIGDDHKEVFQEDNMPALSVYWGETIPYKPQGMMKWKYDPNLKADSWYPQEEKEFPVDATNARRLIVDLMQRDFDVAHSKFYKPGQGMSHSFGYVYYKLMGDKVFPIIPVSINTYYPPNQITPLRAYRLGQAIREAIQEWPDDLRVAVVATGGLSHFVVDEKFDREFLELMGRSDPQGHADLPLEKLQSGNSEFRCWSALAGAVEGLKMDLIDYVPCYRSPAGTGCAMAFASWE
ncbi:protocatechuate 3,4-dioxygenase [Variovorax saccharolyticus]|uniref:DODA-type extradiol aromatic ring-opening family dioxygenase n=1 Tax=Variovorax saccharolyticus TaxID=3053516 RepID=UPI0025787B08|nr:protocatechuate 3,4-dioxygenase [Variovorax sp. J31P216]MDM0029612.1 protocatechuate 3,4-dioxygenase [Variovorax sp. J31P216]